MFFHHLENGIREVRLGAQFQIGALMKNLAAPTNSVFAYHDDAEDRVVITYVGVPSFGTTEPNTLQIAIHGNGTIEMIVGELANTGTIYSPSIIGTLGIAGGHTRIDDLRKVRAIDFSRLRDGGSRFMRFGPGKAIFEQFYAGTDMGACGDDDDWEDADDSDDDDSDNEDE